eukprot:463888-Ditylum_brightwellii.AAC.1
MHIKTSVKATKEWRGIRVDGVKKDLSHKVLTNIVHHNIIATIHYSSRTTSSKPAYIDLYHTNTHYWIVNEKLIEEIPRSAIAEEFTIGDISSFI